MRRPWRRTIVICPGRPVQRRPAARSARSVERSPAAPKSSAWLLATFMTSKPAAVMSFAYDGGAWNAKQFGEPPHLDSGQLRERLLEVPEGQVGAAQRRRRRGAIESRPASGGVP